MYNYSGSLDDYSDLDLALMVLLNVFGSGTKRKKALGARYYAVQDMVNKITSSGTIEPNLSQFPEEKIRAIFNEQRPTDQEYQEYVDAFINALRR